jgi:hypothetical protein
MSCQNNTPSRKYSGVRCNSKILFNHIYTIVSIARSFDAKIVKNLGDGLVCYFPKTYNPTDESAFKDVIECGLTIIAARHIINTKFCEEKLPTVNYRISADYGK